MHSSVHLYDEEPPKLSASQRRRLRRKKTQLLKTLGVIESSKEAAVSEEQFVSKEIVSPPKKPVAEPRKEIARPSDSYSSLPDLVGFPKSGTRIAYKILEMTAEYQPQISAFKVRERQRFNPF